MPRFTARERRDRYQREYTFQKKTGKSFFPYAVFHDTIVSVIVVALIIGMSVLWYAQFEPVPTGAEAAFAERGGGILGPAYEGKADPGVEQYDPKPEWYFFFLFELLRIFKAPELLLVGSFIIPTIWMTLLIGWPFIDRNPDRRLSRRPIAMALGVSVPIVLLALTFYGAQAPGVGGEVSDSPGAAVFANGSCATCHAFADAGTVGQVGPNFNDGGVSYATAVDLITNGKAGMPAYSALYSEDEISCLAGYIATYSGAAAPGEEGPEAATAADSYPASCEAAGGEFAGAGGGAAAP